MSFINLRRNSGNSGIRILENGVIVLKEPKFTAIAACRPREGEYFVADGKRWDSDFTFIVQKYVKKGILPSIEPNKIRTVSMEEIASLYAEAEVEFVEEINDSDRILKKLHQILEDAARAQASDVKFFQRSTRTQIRFKIAGREFNVGKSLTVGEGDNIISILFDRRGQGTGDPSNVLEAFQSFAISAGTGFRMPNGVVKLRGQKGFHETASGIAQHLVIRLFYSDKVQKETATVASLGFDGKVMEALARVRRSLKGAVIIGGTTGDGKSTTLSRCLTEQYQEQDGRISIVTIEDPVEYKMNADGIIQIPVKTAGTPEERQLEYRKALLHFVRINPDVGCISEIRDEEAAKEVLQFVDTGHQVWTTIHVNSANGILFRLIDMGIHPSELAKPDTISLLMKQTLVPVLCTACSIPMGEGSGVGNSGTLDTTLNQFPLDGFDRARFRNGKGCPKCLSKIRGQTAREAWSGYERLQAVAEFIEPDSEYLLKVRSSDTIGAQRHWLLPKEKGGLGGITISQKVEGMIKNGLVDPHDGIRKGWDPVFGEMTSLTVFDRNEAAIKKNNPIIEESLEQKEEWEPDIISLPDKASRMVSNMTENGIIS